MPDFAPNYTARVKMRYAVAGATHTMQVRAPASSAPGDLPDFVDKVIAFLNSLQAKMWSDFTILGWTYALADSDIFLPTGPDTGVFGVGDVSTTGRLQAAKALATSFVGRSSAGLRASLFLYGLTWNVISFATVSDFRIFNSEDSDVSAATGILNETAPPFVANDNNEASWYNYANLKYNDYWTRRLRQGG